jgi:hypothetical protein
LKKVSRHPVSVRFYQFRVDSIGFWIDSIRFRVDYINFGSILSISGRFYPVSGRFFAYAIRSIKIVIVPLPPTFTNHLVISSFIGSGEYAAILTNIIIGTSTRDDVVGTGIVVDILGARRPIRVCLSACFPDYAAISSIITINTATTTKIVSS